MVNQFVVIDVSKYYELIELISSDDTGWLSMVWNVWSWNIYVPDLNGW